MNFKFLVALFIACLSAKALPAQIILDRQDLMTIFEEHAVNGTFVLLDVEKDEIVAVNRSRAQERFIPASTFKIANSLIALELGVIAGLDEVIPYGGKPQTIRAWEQDMTIGEAFKASNVPVFQELARRVGPQQYREYLHLLSYGNALVGTDIERFWLDGPLEISAVEQVRFVRALVTEDLPLKATTLNLVQQIARIETKGDATLFGKSGWTVKPDPDIGWFVGWVTRGDRVFTFALNMDVRVRSDAALREPLARRFLSELGVY